jgi:hypothetical protein
LETLDQEEEMRKRESERERERWVKVIPYPQIALFFFSVKCSADYIVFKPVATELSVENI